jgi:adenine-specific DNA-methyltransferase
MHRVLSIATDPGMSFLDYFLGSGITAAVAHKMGRRWVGMEWKHETVETFTYPRLAKVVAGDVRAG